MKSLVQDFLARLQNRQGCFARANGTFYSAQVVNIALQRIRLDMLDGAELTEQGHRFVHGAAAYLAWLSYNSMKKRGITMRSDIRLDGDPPVITIHAQRQRDGHKAEHYSQPVLNDVYELLLRPPHYFPSLYGTLYPLETLNIPTPEYLYLYGVYLMQSPRAEGNWPHGEQSGGLDDDFSTSRQHLVDDLHRDTGLPLDDDRLRALSWWVVFPPYGWSLNEGQRYNMMTLVDQIAVHPTLPAADGIAYLQALLYSQMAVVYFLAARTLLVLGIAPRNPQETQLYRNALTAADHAVAEEAMIEVQWLLEQSDAPPPEDWATQCRNRWKNIMNHAPSPAWHRDPVFSVAEFQRLETLDPHDQMAAIKILKPLLATMPDNWFLRCTLGACLMPEQEPQQGEQLLRGCLLDAPEACTDAHIHLGNHLKWQGRSREAMQIFEAAVSHCPWHHDAVDSCMWLLSDGLTYKVRGKNT